MTLKKKILAFAILALFLAAGGFCHIQTARADGGLTSFLNMPIKKLTHSKRVKSYTNQDINVNRTEGEEPAPIPDPITVPVYDPPPVVVVDDVEEIIVDAPQTPVVITPAEAPSAQPEEIITEVVLPQEPPVELQVEEKPPTIYMPRPQETPETIVLEKMEPALPVDMTPIAASDGEYILGSDDKVKITVFGEKDLSGDYKIGGDGAVSMPLIGTVMIGQLSLRQAEHAIEQKLRDGYLKDPSVSIEVQESRPFYIMGEVRRPGSYNYVNGMNILQAVAISGGFTYRANQKEIDVIRGQTDTSDPMEMSPDDAVQAGDIIYVRERFF